MPFLAPPSFIVPPSGLGKSVSMRSVILYLCSADTVHFSRKHSFLATCGGRDEALTLHQ